MRFPMISLAPLTVRRGGGIANRGLAGILALVLAASGLALTGVAAPAAAASGQPVIIDNFDGGLVGTTLGTRTITGFPQENSTTAPGQFSESHGSATISANGAGNQSGGVNLDYVFPSTDLTSGGNNTQLFFEFDSISRTPVQTPGETAMVVSASVTDSNNVTGIYNVGLSNTGPFNIVLNFSCANGQTCFAPNPDFTKVTALSIRMAYPKNYDSAPALTAVLKVIRATPTGGAAPAAIVPEITTPQTNIVGLNPTITFPIAFYSDGVPVSVSGFDIADLSLASTGIASAAITSLVGSDSKYTATVSNVTGSGTVALTVNPGFFTDSWGQPNAGASSPVVTVTQAVAPSFTSEPDATLTVGTASSFTATATGSPAPTFTSAGPLPAGITLTSNGTLSGTPSAGSGGEYSPVFTATNLVSSVSQSVALRVNESASLSASGTAAFIVGTAGSFPLTVRGYPVPTLSISEGILPSGLSLSSLGVISGTAAAGSSGSVTLTVQATNTTGSSSATVVVDVSDTPTFTSAAATTFTAESAGSFSVTTSAHPTATLSVQSGRLPSGVTLTPSGLLSGTPIAGTGGTYPLMIRATNSAGHTDKSFTLTVREAPSVTGATTLAISVGEQLPATGVDSFVLRGSGFPVPQFRIAAASRLPDGLTLVDNQDGTATLVGTPAASAAGTHIVTVQATSTDAGFTAADFTITLSVNSLPTFTSVDTAAFSAQVDGSFTPAAEGSPAPTITTSPLPAGLTFSNGRITGSPAVGTGGIHVVQLSATNSRGTATQSLTITIAETSAIIGAATADFAVGTNGSLPLVSDGFPAPTLSLTKGTLPAGVRLTDLGSGKAALSGSPATGTGGTYSVVVTAVNLAGSVTHSITLTVTEAPTVDDSTTGGSGSGPGTGTGSGSTPFEAGSAVSVSIAGNGFPAPTFSVQHGELPDGLTLSPEGLITGVPATASGGRYEITVRATNPTGTVDQVITLVVNEDTSFTSAAAGSFTAGTDHSMTVTTLGFPRPAIQVLSGALPAGLALVDHHDGTATISGTPSPGSGGIYVVTVGAKPHAAALMGTRLLALGTPTDQQTLTIRIDEAPALTVTGAANATAGSTFRLAVSASGFPVPALAVVGTMPAGLTFVDNGDGSGVISGTPEAASVGSYSVQVTATSVIDEASVPLEIRVAAAEVLPKPTPTPTNVSTPTHPAGPTAVTAASGDLASTGVNSSLAGAVALALLALGFAFLLRRRRA